MKHRISLVLFVAVCLLSLGLVGCSEEKGATLSKDDASQLHAAPGQPMPAEAKAMMEKGTQAGQANASGPAAAPPPAAPPTAPK